MITVTKRLLDFIKQWEGVRHRVYLDSVNKPTVGVGHLILEEDHLQVGDLISDARVDEFLTKDLGIAISAVNRLVTVPLTENQGISLCSFVFNLGSGVLKNSLLLKRLNGGNPDAAANEFAKYVFAGHKRIQGLVNRRAAEKQLFLTPETK